ncbi:hypothetical protein H2136_18310 [Aeromonas hydrophila]|uniref:Uncharacterized protein n=1 Tax=Aeromonas hydrophila TaxID=644 RepID=A0A926IZ43_AERHY|nr:hypothetical protein [Aeromonas hydrophila]
MGAPASLINQLNDYVGRQGNHGHGDDLFVMSIPETQHSLTLAIWPQPNLTDEQKTALKAGAESLVRRRFASRRISQASPAPGRARASRSPSWPASCTASSRSYRASSLRKMTSCRGWPSAPEHAGGDLA